MAVLEESPYRVYRLCTKVFFVTCFYVFLFYFFYIQSNVMLLANQNILHQHNVTIATVDYPIVTTDTNAFETSFNTTNQTVAALVGLGCFISGYNGNPNYSELVFDTSSSWIGFVVAGILSLLFIVILKGWQSYKFDLIKAIYNY